jgi:mediator of RNA polymerase II transcription subunit 12, fungi type
MDAIFKKKISSLPQLPYVCCLAVSSLHPLTPSSESTFRMPSRVTMNDARRNAWYSDLANPEVPLHKLGKNVPHGAKGHDLLDLLHNSNVAIPRAVWFIRLLGANETVSYS